MYVYGPSGRISPSTSAQGVELTLLIEPGPIKERRLEGIVGRSGELEEIHYRIQYETLMEIYLIAVPAPCSVLAVGPRAVRFLVIDRVIESLDGVGKQFRPSCQRMNSGQKSRA